MFDYKIAEELQPNKRILTVCAKDILQSPITANRLAQIYFMNLDNEEAQDVVDHINRTLLEVELLRQARNMEPLGLEYLNLISKEIH